MADRAALAVLRLAALALAFLAAALTIGWLGTSWWSRLAAAAVFLTVLPCAAVVAGRMTS